MFLKLFLFWEFLRKSYSMVYYLCYLKFVHFHGSFSDKFLIYNLFDHMSHFHFCKIFIIVMH